jgi:predicted DCC family thiol-disulfide oxidoreductase YuxK
MQKENHIVLYDGDCGLCSRSVKFIRKRDKRNTFNYMALQSKEAKQLSGSEQIGIKYPDTVIFYSNSRFYYRSEAAIRIMIKLGGIYSLSAIFLLVPGRIRDYFYNLIARNRHRFFKREDNCSIDETE